MPESAWRFLKKQGCNPHKFTFIRKEAEGYVFEYKPTGQRISIRG